LEKHNPAFYSYDLAICAAAKEISPIYYYDLQLGLLRLQACSVLYPLVSEWNGLHSSDVI